MGDMETDFVPVMAFMASDSSKFITGQTISVDGGIMMVPAFAQLAGDGAALCAGAFGESLANVRLAPMNRRIQTASSVALAALERVRNGGTLSAAELMPVYLRLPQAQRELNKRLGRET